MRRNVRSSPLDTSLHGNRHARKCNSWSSPPLPHVRPPRRPPPRERTDTILRIKTNQMTENERVSHNTQVWAPAAECVAIQINGSEHPMEPDDSGWWRLEFPRDLHGADYAFILDGG